MQQLAAITIRHLGRELHDWLAGAKVSKLQHPSSHEFLVTFWGGPTRLEHQNLLLINLQPAHPFCALIESKTRHEAVRNVFEKPTALCMLLRKHLNGANLLEVRTMDGERVIDFRFENFNELGNRVHLVLSLELMGKHTNMIFYDEVSQQILAVAHGVSEAMSSRRELAAGLPYAPPPRPMGKKRLSELALTDFELLCAALPPGEDLAARLNRHLEGFGHRLLEDACQHGFTGRALFEHLQRLENGEWMQPAIHREGERFTIVPPVDPGEWLLQESVNAMIGGYFIRHVQARRMAERRQQLLAALDKQATRLRRRESELVPEAGDAIDHLQATGDRLLAALSTGELPEPGQIKKGQVVLTRYETGEPWPIDVDPSLSWVENAQLYYRRAKKAKARQEAYQQMIDQLHDEQQYVLELRNWVEQAETLGELDALADDLVMARYLKPAGDKPKGGKKKEDEMPPGVLRVPSSDGFELLIGRNGQANDAIVGRLSRSDDWWLHVHNMPGSHVLIRTRGQEVPDQTLLEAANLAVYYSTGRHSANVPVLYTPIRYVRKIAHSYPGHVNYRQEQTVFITVDMALIERLLEPVAHAV